MLAVDVDPHAARHAAASAAAAGLAGAVTVRRAPIAALTPADLAGRVLLANVPMPAHRELLRAGAGAAPAAAVLSGIRPGDAAALRDAWTARGLRPDGAWEGDGWALPSAGGRVSRVWRTWSVLVLFALGTSLITPLIPLYQDRLGFSDTVVTLFLGCYVAALVPSMLTLGQVSDRIGRKSVLLGALATLAVAQVILITEPDLTGLLVARAVQGLATGAFFGTCTAFLVNASPPGRTPFVAVLGSVSVRLGLGFGPGIGGVIAQYSDNPLRLPFELHLIAIALAAAVVLTLPETVRVRSRRPLTLRLEVPAAERAVFWRVLVPSGALFSLFDGVALSLIPVFLVRTLGVDNYALVGAAGFLVLVSGAVSQLVFPASSPPGDRLGARGGVGGVGGGGGHRPPSPPRSRCARSAATGAAAGLVFKGGIDLCTQIAPVQDRGKLLSSYYVACYMGGFSVPLLVVGVLSDQIGLTAALACLSAARPSGPPGRGRSGCGPSTACGHPTPTPGR